MKMVLKYCSLLVIYIFIRTCNGKIEPYIIGGGYTNIKDCPHAVYLYLNGFTCGSSILNQQILLTAGHCGEEIKDVKDGKYLAVAGSTDSEQAVMMRHIESYIIHDNYDYESLSNDICLLKLAVPLKLQSTVRRVVITPNYPKVQDAYMAGWGYVDKDGLEDTNLLKKIYYKKIMSPQKCRSHIEFKGTLCAAHTNKDKNMAYSGDSGSALVVNGYQQIGLVSYLDDRTPGITIYTNVTYFFNWIQKTSKLLYCHHH